MNYHLRIVLALSMLFSITFVGYAQSATTDWASGGIAVAQCAGLPFVVSSKRPVTSPAIEKQKRLLARADAWYALAQIAYDDEASAKVGQAIQSLAKLQSRQVLELVDLCNGVDLRSVLELDTQEPTFIQDPLDHAMADFAILGEAKDRSTEQSSKDKYDRLQLKIQSVMTVFEIQETRKAADPDVFRWLTKRNGGGMATIRDIRIEDLHYCIRYYAVGVQVPL